ncbi:MAG TPA: hypothetical protein VGI72_04335 [Gaiellales bacterium]|jgi:hypothetical protein
MSVRRAPRRSVAALAATTALFAIAAVVYATGPGFTPTDVLDACLFGVLMLGMSAIGILIARRQPRNPVGWLFSIAPLCVAVAVAGGTIDVWAGPKHHDLPGAGVAGWVSQWTWPIGMLAFAIFLPLLFPDGRPPAGRWRLLVRFDLAALASLGLVLMTEPGNGNALGVDGALRTPVVALVVVMIVAAMVVGLVSAVVRYRRSGPTERLQLRECLFAVCLTFVGFIVISMLSPHEALYTLDYALIPVAVGLAMVRYRLYDVDVVIRRTLVYGALVGMLAGLYLAGVAGLGAGLRAATGLSSSLAVTLSTLAVIGAFQPLRRRTQRAVDRRFYRAAYDARATVEAFSGELREQIDLDVLADRLLVTVRETVRPRTASVWLAPVTIPERASGKTEA